MWKSKINSWCKAFLWSKWTFEVKITFQHVFAQSGLSKVQFGVDPALLFLGHLCKKSHEQKMHGITIREKSSGTASGLLHHLTTLYYTLQVNRIPLMFNNTAHLKKFCLKRCPSFCGIWSFTPPTMGCTSIFNLYFFKLIQWVGSNDF